jgi:Zn-dependent metalloprotease
MLTFLLLLIYHLPLYQASALVVEYSNATSTIQILVPPKPFSVPNKGNDNKTLTIQHLLNTYTGYGVDIDDITHIQTTLDPHVVGWTVGVYAQKYKELPVRDANLKILWNEYDEIVMVSGCMIPGINMTVNPSISSTNASNIAYSHMSKTGTSNLQVRNVGSSVFRTNFTMGEPGENILVWEVVLIEGNLTHEVLVDVHTGNVVDVIENRHSALARVVVDKKGYISWQENDDPPDDTELNTALQATRAVYNLFRNMLNITFDQTEFKLVQQENCIGARWTGSMDSPTVEYCTGYGLSPDIIAHEWAHFYENTGTFDRLSYSNQPGALSESFADIIGESLDIILSPEDKRQYLDCVHKSGSHRWIKGNALPDEVKTSSEYMDMVSRYWLYTPGVGDLFKPTCFASRMFGYTATDGNHRFYPNRISDAVCTNLDNGGVHFNSYISSHVFAFLVDGNELDGLEGIGLYKALHIYFRAKLACQTPGTTFAMHASCLQQSCRILSKYKVLLPKYDGTYLDSVMTDGDCLTLDRIIEVSQLKEPVCSGRTWQDEETGFPEVWSMSPPVVPMEGGEVTVTVQAMTPQQVDTLRTCKLGDTDIPGLAFTTSDPFVQFITCQIPPRSEVAISNTETTNTYVLEVSNGNVDQHNMFFPTPQPMTVTYFHAPTISDVHPRCGSVLGGTNVTLTGTNFIVCSTCSTNWLKLTVGGVEPTLLSMTDTTIVFVVPPAREHTPSNTNLVIDINGKKHEYAHTYQYIHVASVEDISVGGECDIGQFRADKKMYYCDVFRETEILDISVTLTEPNASLEISYPNGDIRPGYNLIEVGVVGTDNIEQTVYQIMVYQALSNNVLLYTLEIEHCEISFSPEVFVYECNVPFSVETLAVAAVPQFANASVTVLHAEDLPQGNEHVVSIVVQAEDHSQGSYLLYVTRQASADATLSYLVMSHGCNIEPPFQPHILEYECQVPSIVDRVKVFCSPSDIFTDFWNQVEIYPDSGTMSQSLNQDYTTINILVRAQNNQNTQMYVVKVNRTQEPEPHQESRLLSWDLVSVENPSWRVELDPTFNPDIFEYNCTVPSNVNELRSWAVGGVEFDSDPSIFALKTGTKKYYKRLYSASSPNVAALYSIEVTQLSPSVNALSELELTGCELSPQLAGDVFDYVCTVPYETHTVGVGEFAAVGTYIYPSDLSATQFSLVPGISQTLVINVPGAERSYNVTITRSYNNDASLANLWVVGDFTFSPQFSPLLYSGYLCYVPFEVTNTSLVYTTSDPNATVTTEGAAMVNSNLDIGENQISVTVVAANNEDIQTYTVTIIRTMSIFDSLTNLTIDGCDIKFSPDTTAYTCVVSKYLASISVRASTPPGSLARAQLTQEHMLYSSTQIVRVVVVAQDVRVSKTYSVFIRRVLEVPVMSVSTLTGVALEPGCVLQPMFNPEIHEYSCWVGEEVTSIRVLPVLNDTQHGSYYIRGTGTIPHPFRENVIQIEVRAQDFSKSYYEVIVHKEPSSSTAIKYFKFRRGCTLSPAWSTSEDGIYECDLDYEIDYVMPDIVPVHNGTSTVVSGNQRLLVGNQLITITGTAEDKVSLQKWFVVLYRKIDPLTKDNSLLKNVYSSNGCDIGRLWTHQHSGYSCHINNDVVFVDFFVETCDERATVSTDAPVRYAPFNNRVGITVTSEDGTNTTTYSIDVFRTPSSNVELSHMLIGSQCNITYAKDQIYYLCNVSHNTDIIDIDVETKDYDAINDLNRTQLLNIGTNLFFFNVTASDKKTRLPYTLEVYRIRSDDNSLASMEVDICDFVFHNNRTEYFCEVPFITDRFTLYAQTTDSEAVVLLSKSVNESLVVGENTVVVTVVAPNPIHVQDYILVINRNQPSTSTELTGLEVTNCNLDSMSGTGFYVNQNTYWCTWDLHYDRTAVFATVTEPTSTIAGWHLQDTNTYYHFLEPQIGLTRVDFTVYAQNETVMKRNSVTIIRAENELFAEKIKTFWMTVLYFRFFSNATTNIDLSVLRRELGSDLNAVPRVWVLAAYEDIHGISISVGTNQSDTELKIISIIRSFDVHNTTTDSNIQFVFSQKEYVVLLECGTGTYTDSVCEESQVVVSFELWVIMIGIGSACVSMVFGIFCIRYMLKSIGRCC